MTDEAKAGVEAKAAARVSYDAEFEVEAEVTPEVSEALARLEAPETRSLGSLLGPSPRTILQRIEVAFGQKIRVMEQEVAEMMEREVGLKQANRAAVEHNHRLGAERDALVATVDPDGTMRLLREENAKLRIELASADKDRTEAIAARNAWIVRHGKLSEQLTATAKKRTHKPKKRGAR